MKTTNYKWIEFKKDKYAFPIARVDVTMYNKKGIEAEWNRLERKYPNHLSCLISKKWNLDHSFSKMIFLRINNYKK